jgi:alkanesulfonate monooxygenase SsuD/methylene tetrahydromethanopterin reductase-like flavin-dependent oxidoreductase (luciferase family)
MTRAHFDAGLGIKAHLAVGSPQQVIEKILYQHEKLGHQRYMMQMSVGTMPHAQTMRSIELFGTKVAGGARRHEALDHLLLVAHDLFRKPVSLFGIMR